MGLLGQVLQPHDLRFIVGAVHVVDLELLEIADDDPAGNLVIGQIPGIAAGLLVGGQHTAVRLLVPFPQVDIPALLLNQDTGRRNVAVNKAGVIQLHREFKGDVLVRLGHVVYLLQQGNPE